MANKKAAEAVETATEVLAVDEGQTAQKMPVTFGKSNIVRMKRYSGRRDLLNTLLEDGRYYTFAEVDNILKDFMER